MREACLGALQQAPFDKYGTAVNPISATCTELAEVSEQSALQNLLAVG